MNPRTYLRVLSPFRLCPWTPLHPRCSAPGDLPGIKRAYFHPVLATDPAGRLRPPKRRDPHRDDKHLGAHGCVVRQRPEYYGSSMHCMACCHARRRIPSSGRARPDLTLLQCDLRSPRAPLAVHRRLLTPIILNTRVRCDRMQGEADGESAPAVMEATGSGAHATPPLLASTGSDGVRDKAPPEKKQTSSYRGVCWNKKNKRWQAAINSTGRCGNGAYRAREGGCRTMRRMPAPAHPPRTTPLIPPQVCVSGLVCGGGGGSARV